MSWIKGYQDWQINETVLWSREDREYWKKASELERELRRDIQDNSGPSITEGELEKIISDFYSWDPTFQREDVQHLLAMHPSLSMKRLLSFSHSPNKHVRSGVAANASAPGYTLEELSTDDSVNVRMAVAGNPNTPVEILQKYSDPEEPEHWEVRGALAKNPGATTEIYKRLARDRSEVIDYLVENPNVPTEALELIDYDNMSEHALWYISMHPNVPISILVRLRRGKIPYVSDTANKKLNELAKNPINQKKIEELESLLDLGINSTGLEDLNLDELDI